MLRYMCFFLGFTSCLCLILWSWCFPTKKTGFLSKHCRVFQHPATFWPQVRLGGFRSLRSRRAGQCLDGLRLGYQGEWVTSLRWWCTTHSDTPKWNFDMCRIPQKEKERHTFIYSARDIYIHQEVAWPSTQLAASLDIDDTDYTIANCHHLLNRIWSFSWLKESQGCSVHVELKGKLCQIIRSFSWKVRLGPKINLVSMMPTLW